MAEDERLYRYRKGVPRVSSKNQVTLPVSALTEAGLRAGDEVVIESIGDGEIRVRRAGVDRMEAAFGALTGVYGPGYLADLDAEEAELAHRRGC